MQYRTLGRSSLNISRIGVGTWVFGGDRGEHGWGSQDDKSSIATLHHAFEHGVNWVDTAPAYGLGHAEALVGRVIRTSTFDIMVATKCGLAWREGKQQAEPILKAANIRQQAEQSLRRLGVDTIDLYQIHWPRPRVDLEEAWQTIADLIREGKVRYAGVSNFGRTQLERLNAIHPVISLQPPYNPIERGIESELLQCCVDNEIGVIAYRPLYAGLLTGEFDKARANALVDTDWRSREPNFNAPLLTVNLDFVKGFQEMAARVDPSPACLAVNWVLARKGVSSTIVGARTPIQLDASVSELSLASEVVNEISALADKRDAGARALRR